MKLIPGNRGFTKEWGFESLGEPKDPKQIPRPSYKGFSNLALSAKLAWDEIDPKRSH